MDAAPMDIKQVIISVVFMGLLAAAYILQGRRVNNTEANSKIDTTSMQRGPIRHQTLDDALIARVRAFESILADLYPISHEKWIEGFQRDLNPESEIAIWESIAEALRQFSALGPVSADERKEAFSVLLARSGSDNVDSTLATLKHLSQSKAQALLGLYTVRAKPITFAPAPR
jgi:hypothetical protein